MAMLRAEKKNEAGGIRIAPKEFTNFTDKQLERLIRHQLSKNPHLLKHRKYIETKASYKLIEKKVTGPRIINKKTTGKTTIQKEIIAQRAPGPHTYNQDDRFLHERLRTQVWGKMKDDRPFNKVQLPDRREILYPSLDAIKPKVPGPIIAKEHVMTDYEIDKLYEQVCGPGPASFNPEHKLTEKRTDVGVPKFTKPFKEESVEIDDKAALYPNTAAILPNHMTFKYHVPADVGPQHTPEKVKKPGEWKYYEVDLDAVREQVAKNVFIAGGGATQEQFEEKEEMLNALKEYLRRKVKQPEVGQYDAKKPEKHLADIDFDKQIYRTKFEDEDDEADIEGDCLILDPRQIEGHKPEFDFGKMVGRGDDFADLEEQDDEIILNPNPDVVRKAQGKGGAIPMDK